MEFDQESLNESPRISPGCQNFMVPEERLLAPVKVLNHKRVS